MATCNICRADYPQGTDPCWRCGGSNKYWEDQRQLPAIDRSTAFFGNVWGFMAFVVNIFPFTFVVGILMQSIATWVYPTLDLGFQRTGLLGQSMAWFLSFICILFVYALRFQLWHYSWIRNIRWQKTPSLHMAAGGLFVLGMAVILIYLTAQMYWQPSQVMPGPASSTQPTTVGPVVIVITPAAPGSIPGIATQSSAQASSTRPPLTDFLRKIIMPLIYASIFVCLCLASVLMAEVFFIARLNDHVGQPIYMNTKLLAMVVQNEAVTSLELTAPEALRVSSLKRTFQGGIVLRLNYVRDGDSDDGLSPSDGPRERRFDVEANEWGQIVSLTELAMPQPVPGRNGQPQAQGAATPAPRGTLPSAVALSVEKDAQAMEGKPQLPDEKSFATNSDRLVDAVRSGVARTYNIAPPVTLEVANMERMTNGGLRMTLNRLKDGEFDGTRYEVEADEWGHIVCLDQRPIPQDKPASPNSNFDLPDDLSGLTSEP